MASLNEPEITELLVNEYKNATNMTDQVSALAALCQNPGDARSQALSDFYDQWKEEALVSSGLRLENSFKIPFAANIFCSFGVSNDFFLALRSVCCI